MNQIELPSAGEILNEEFLIPMNISSYKLAHSIGVPTSRILEIINGKRKITIDTSLRLAKYFGVSDLYFYNIQTEIDSRKLKVEIQNDLSQIQCVV